ncbi:hypothetical protein [Cereibacter sphaeroides]|uniref:hypothetical protein n=1 Tax=Cereibacter sphaeroides TaxID=1063 RepID=UPI000191C8E2|nr:hypothetical protein [Cereibacter sphaeroides]ACM02404.1 Hypothetical Protein RSKD131_2544 [Cereibacter sphaeroides KD131]AZB62433.1 hypothetical protein EBL87_01340 [Cereibacter sphaeroides]AZB69616.1 hypothetical protein EBL86_15085 [Cereibacter sphaeroides]
MGMTLLTKILAGGLALIAAAPAFGSGRTFTPPEGCTAFLTVQSRGCRVSHHYRCDKDPAGDQWRVDFDQEGIFFSSHIDREAQWVESYEMFPTVRQALDPNPADPASFTELLSGADSYDFGLTRSTGERSRVTGYDRLTGRSFTIDGIVLQETEFEFTETSIGGTVLRQAQGNEYIHPEWRLFFAGPTRWSDGTGGSLPVDGSPVDFVFPGEPGFLATEPIFDCDAILSQAPEDGLIVKVRHDR